MLVTVVAWASAVSVVFAHEQTDPRPGLSEAARVLSGARAAIGPAAPTTHSLSGQFHLIFGDAPASAGGVGIYGYVIIDDQGDSHELIIDEQTLRAHGGAQAINRLRVIVTGQTVSPPTGMRTALPLFSADTLQLDVSPRAADLARVASVGGPQPWATILCKFSDNGAEPNPNSFFQTLIMGGSAPSLDHYWREQSYNNANLTGSGVFGWYTLPHPRSYYVYGSPLQLDFGRAFSDCTGVAGVNLASYVGVNLMFNAELDGYAWGGTWGGYRTTWVPPWGYQNQGPIAHEMGHGFGLHHSSGPYTNTYDSRWDVMSDIWDNCPPYNYPGYGCESVGTIAYHKDQLGWIPSSQRYIAAQGTSQTILMERLDQPTTSNYLIAKLPIGGSSTSFYTVEVRRFAGYDQKVPGQGVVIHKVDTTLSDRNAKVVDRWGVDPVGPGAIWLPPSDAFVDAANQFTVAVNAQIGNGYQVTITNGTVTTTTFALSVTISGTGTVTSNPSGINCSSGTCVASFTSGTSVTLSASSGNLSAWGGSCSGAGACAVSMTQNRSVSATFALPPVVGGNPTTLAPSSNVTAAWSGIGTPTSMDWIGLYPVGAADTAFVSWSYVSCSQVPGAPAAAGSCSLPVPSTLAAGSYELRLLANNNYVRLATSNVLTVAAAATLSASPTTVTAGGSVTATWSGIASPTAMDWMGLYAPGAPDTAYLAWMYVSCTGTPSTAKASGSCAFGIPGTLAAGTYQLRLFGSNGYTRLATGNALTVTVAPPAGPTVSASPTTVATGASTTATWSGIASPTASDWIGLYAPGAPDTAYLAWMYVSCTTAPSTAKASGSCAFGIPTTIAGGTYQLRLFSNNGFTRLATGNALSVTPSVGGNPASVARGGSVTATWSGIVSPAGMDWVGLYQPGAADTAFVAWVYVSCTQVPGSPRAAGSCAFTIPTNIAPGSYQLRLFTNNSYTRIATGNTLTVN